MQRELKHSHNCEHCGDWFESNRYDARFCSAKCRKQDSRSALAANKAAERIQTLLEEYRQKYIIGQSVNNQSYNAGLLKDTRSTVNGILDYWSN